MVEEEAAAAGRTQWRLQILSPMKADDNQGSGKLDKPGDYAVEPKMYGSGFAFLPTLQPQSLDAEADLMPIFDAVEAGTSEDAEDPAWTTLRSTRESNAMKDSATEAIIRLTASELSRKQALEAELAAVKAAIPPVQPYMWPLYYIECFIAEWFGAKMLDMDGDGKFDEDDLLITVNCMTGAKDNIMKKRMLEKKLATFTQIEKAFTEAKTIMASKSNLKEEQGLHDVLGGLLKLKESSMDKVKEMMNFSKNNDGELDVDDVFAVMEADVEGERFITLETYRRWWIVYIPIQCLAASALWIILAFAEPGDKSLNLTQAGLDNLAEGDTDLRLQTDCVRQMTEVWRWFTYQYTHIGPMHVGMNVFLTLAFGCPLEGLNGCFRMFFCFQLGVFGGALVSFVCDPLEVVVGMSGGVYSLMGMFFADLIVNWNQKKYRRYSLLLVAALIAADIINFNMQHGDVKASHSAHFGGWAVGLLCGITFGKDFVVKKIDIVMKVIAVVLFATGAVLMILWTATQFPNKSIWGGDGSDYCWMKKVWSYEHFGDQAWHCIQCNDLQCIESWAKCSIDKVTYEKHGMQIRSVLRSECGKGTDSPVPGEILKGVSIENCGKPIQR